MLKSVGIKCKAFLDHMIKFRKRNNKRANNTEPSIYLAIDVNEIQESILNPTVTDLIGGNMIACVD